MKKIAGVVAAVMLVSSLAACGGSETEDLDIDTGVVTYSYRKNIKVREDDGEMENYRVGRSIVKKCSVGERWPDCKK